MSATPPATQDGSARLLMVVPTLNEAESLPLLVERFFAAAPPEAELLVVDDASPDGTAAICRGLMASQPRLHLLERKGPPGFGRAQTAGLLWALERDYPLIGTMDADLSHDPAHLGAMRRRIHDHDVVVGSRYVRDGGTINWGVGRVLLSWTANAFAATLLNLGLHDMTSGFRLYRAEVLRSLPFERLTSTGYSFLVELLHRVVLRGARVAESPIVFFDRRMGASKLQRREIWRGALALLRLRLALGRAPDQPRMVPPPDEPSAFWRLLSWISLGLAALLVVAQAGVLLPLLDDLPTWDQWALIPLWQAHYEGGAVAPLLFEPYNGHFNVLARAVIYGLGTLSHWNLRLEVYACYAVALVTLALLLRLARASDPRLGVLAAPIAAQVFALSQYENFCYGYSVGQQMAQLGLTATVALLCAASGSARAYFGAAATALSGTMSWGAGIVAWPAGLVVLALGPRRGRMVRLAGWLALGGACALLARRAAGAASIHWRWDVTEFTLALLGRPWSPQVVSPGRAASLGAAALVLAFVASLAAVRAGRLAALRPWLALGLSAAGGAVLVAQARVHAGTGQALASHYVTVAYPLGLLALVALGLVAVRPAAGLAARAVFTLAAGAALAQPVWLSIRWSRTLAEWRDVRVENARAIVLRRATDAQIRQSHHPDPELVRTGVEVLRRHGLTWFARADVPQLSANAPPPVRGTPRAEGSVDLVQGQPLSGAPPCWPAGAAVTLEGWAACGARPADEVRLRLDGQLAGAAWPQRPRPDVARARGAGLGHSGFLLAAAPWPVAPAALELSAVCQEREVPFWSGRPAACEPTP